MKKVSFYLMVLILSLGALPTQILAHEKNSAAIAIDSKTVPAEVTVLLQRLDEIKAMDKSKLQSTEKKALRKEVRAIKSTLRTTGNGIYLSVGAIIIIILLLILLL